MKRFWLFYFVLLAVSASAQQQIDLYANLSNHQKVVLSQVAKEIRYVPLETTDNCLLSDELQVYDAEDCIFVGDQKNSAFFRFGKDGKLLNQIGQKGQGPGEYERVLFFTVDDKTRIIYLVDTSGQSLMAYTFEGQFVRKIPMEVGSWRAEAIGGNLLYSNNRYYRKKAGDSVNELYLADQTGRVLYKTPSSVAGDGFPSLIMNQSFFYRHKEDVFYKNVTDDFVYQVKDGLKLTKKYLVNTASADKHEKDDYKDLSKYAQRIIIQNIYEDNQRLIFFYAYQEAMHYMIYNKSDGKLYNALASDGKDGFTDDWLNGPSFIPFMFAGGKGNVVISIVPSETILETKSLLQKCPELKALNADSNPVLGIVTLK